MNITTTSSPCVIDPATDPLWMAFINSHPDALIFHHPAWLSLLRAQYGFKTLAICLIKDGEIVAGIPFCRIKASFSKEKWICLPFSDCCGPLASSPADLRILLYQARLLATKERKQVEIRSGLEPDLGFVSLNTHWSHVANIEQDPEKLLKSFKPRVWQPVKKAQKSSLTTEIRRDAEAFDIFYRLHLKTRRKQGVPIQPHRYFRLFGKHILKPNLGFISMVRNGEQYLSAGVFCGFKRTIVYKYGASDPVYLKFHPNHLMLWEAMLYARRQGYSRFDFGKTDPANTGLTDFKDGWNTIKAELYYSYFPEIAPVGLLGALNRHVVQLLIKRSPAFVCRVAGELLYKRFAV